MMRIILILVLLFSPHVFADTVMPSCKDAASGMKPVILLPGQDEFAFTIYGAPGDPETIRALIQKMKDLPLGNGFDPAPLSREVIEVIAPTHWPVICYPPRYGEFQIKEARSHLEDSDEAALRILDDTGAIGGIQLGEWGYYFHNLSMDRAWWQNVFGADFDQFEQYIKPPGLAGYDTIPESRQAAYDVIKDYFTSRDKAFRGRTVSVTGHSHYEAYAAEWGARVIGLEVGENISFTQSKFAFARGASRVWKRPWCVQVSPWFHGSVTTAGPLLQDGNIARGLDAGHSLSLYKRLWMHAWFSGAAMVTPENSYAIFFETGYPDFTLNSHGQAAADFFRFTQNHDRGTPYTPVAIVLDHLAGFNGYMKKPWGIFEPTAGDLAINKLFTEQLFPGADHIHYAPDPVNPEKAYLCPTPYGEIFDVLLSNADAQTLSTYPLIMLVGDLNFDELFMKNLLRAMKHGSKVIAQESQVATLTPQLLKYKNFIVDASGAPDEIGLTTLKGLLPTLLPVHIDNKKIQYAINRSRTGWLIEVINNNGVIKKPAEAAIVDKEAVEMVHIQVQVPIESAKEWMTEKTFAKDSDIILEVPPGEVRIVELVCAGE